MDDSMVSINTNPDDLDKELIESQDSKDLEDVAEIVEVD